jgi:hypothetical protein
MASSGKSNKVPFSTCFRLTPADESPSFIYCALNFQLTIKNIPRYQYRLNAFGSETSFLKILSRICEKNGTNFQYKKHQSSKKCEMGRINFYKRKAVLYFDYEIQLFTFQ